MPEFKIYDHTHGMLTIQPLDPDKFNVWKDEIDRTLTTLGIKHHITQRVACPDDRKAATKWYSDSYLVWSILNTTTLEVKHRISRDDAGGDFRDPDAFYQLIRTSFTDEAVVAAFKEFVDLDITRFKSSGEFLDRFLDLASVLDGTEHALGESAKAQMLYRQVKRLEIEGTSTDLTRR